MEEKQYYILGELGCEVWDRNDKCWCFSLTTMWNDSNSFKSEGDAQAEIDKFHLRFCHIVSCEKEIPDN